MSMAFPSDLLVGQKGFIITQVIKPHFIICDIILWWQSDVVWPHSSIKIKNYPGILTVFVKGFVENFNVNGCDWKDY